MAQLSTSSPSSEGPPRLQEVMGLIPVWDSDISELTIHHFYSLIIHDDFDSTDPECRTPVTLKLI